MKSIVFPLFLIFPLLSYAQSNEFGKLVEDTLVLHTGERFWKGKEVRLGYGSNGAKGFQFITLSPWSIAGPLPLGSGWANLKMTVKDFAFGGTKRTGKKFYVVAKGGNLSPYWIDIVSALEQKEVISDVGSISQVDGPSESSADISEQIRKLKELKDSGALTQEQYDQAIKKILQ